MDITTALLAEAAEVDEDGRLDIYGVVRRIEARSVPHYQPLLSLVLTLRATAGERGAARRIALHVVDQDGRAVAPPREHTLNVPEEPESIVMETDQIVDLVGLQFPDYGDYYFDLLIDGDSRRQLRLRVSPAGKANRA